jgi:hypothetical protein
MHTTIFVIKFDREKVPLDVILSWGAFEKEKMRTTLCSKLGTHQ